MAKDVVQKAHNRCHQINHLKKWFAEREQLMKEVALKNKATIAKMKQLEDQPAKKAVQGKHNKEVATVKKMRKEEEATAVPQAVRCPAVQSERVPPSG